MFIPCSSDCNQITLYSQANEQVWHGSSSATEYYMLTSKWLCNINRLSALFCTEWFTAPCVCLFLDFFAYYSLFVPVLSKEIRQLVDLRLF